MQIIKYRPTVLETGVMNEQYTILKFMHLL